MKLKTLLKLQLVYVVLGMAYNLVSLWLKSIGQPPLSATQPLIGIIGMGVFVLFLLPGYLRKIVVYRILMGLAVIYLGLGGVITHIFNIFSQPSLYSSVWAWAGALGINLFGLVLNVMAALGIFKTDEPQDNPQQQ